VSLLREAAIRNPSKEQLTPYPEEWHSWLFLTFSETPFKELAETGKQLHRIPNEYLVQSLWIWRHGAKQWKNLHSYAFCNQEWRVFDRLAEIIPSDDLEAWDDLVLWHPTDHGEIRAFCRWVPPKHVEALRAHFNHSDRDWRACAYQNYLSKAPEAILGHLWRQSEDLPGWQAKLLDRRLFAPEGARPAAVIEDIQKVEGDLRLQDPFNHRCF
jgi:hypothetical protein